MGEVNLRDLRRVEGVMCIVSILNRLALDHVSRFDAIFRSGRLPALKNLYFSFRFPQELEKAWKASSFGRGGTWPFDDIGCFKNECFGIDFIKRRVPQKFFIVFKHPIDVLLKHTIAIQSFIRHSCIECSREQ